MCIRDSLSYLLSNAAKLQKSCETCIFKLFLLLKIRGGIRLNWKKRRNFGLEICRLFENRPLIGFCDCIFLDGMAIVCLFNPLFCFLFVSYVLAQLWVQLESKRKDLLKIRIAVGINLRFTLKIYPTSWHKSKKQARMCFFCIVAFVVFANSYTFAA